MNNFMLKLEAFGGSGIELSCDQAQALADRLEFTVCFDFNDYEIMCRPGDDPKSTALKFLASISGKPAGSKIIVGDQRNQEPSSKDRLLAVVLDLIEVVEGTRSVRWAADGIRLKDTKEWCALYVAARARNGKKGGAI